MSRTPFDQFAKQFFESFLAPLGEVKVNFEVPGEPKFIDIWFSPSNQPNLEAQNLGILKSKSSSQIPLPQPLCPYPGEGSRRRGEGFILRLLLLLHLMICFRGLLQILVKTG